MDTVNALEWSRILFGSQEAYYFLEIIARVCIIYLFALVIFRAGGKRSREQMTSLELILMVAVGSALGDVLVYPTVAVFYTVTILLMVIVQQWLTERLKRQIPFLELFINSRPKLLVHDGKVLSEAMSQENITTEELYSALRENGVRDLGEVEYAFLELSGKISAFKYPKETARHKLNIIPIPGSNSFMAS